MNRPVRIAVVGLGYWGPNLVRALEEVTNVHVTWLCDVRRETVDRVGRRYPSAARTTQVDDVLDDDGLDAVVVATPISTHYPIASAALAAGKHTFVEKPLTTSSSEAVALARLAKARGLVLMPGHTFLYSPPVRTVKRLIDEGALGDIYFVSTSRVNLGIHQADVSVAWDLGPHDFSILRYWLGENPLWVSALTRSCVLPDVPDVAFVNATFPSHTIAHVELSWLAPSKLRRTTIVGSRQMVVYDDTSNEPVRIFDSGVSLPDFGSFGEHRLSYRTGDIISPRIEHDEPLVVEFADFVAAIREGRRPISHIDLGIDVIRVIEAVERSLSDFGARTPVDLAVRAEVA
ncbi:MAG TPA: Gfo/Idh/MocA family oxidoreductase [Gaiellaceae bacterium]|nr:Gfo/Idh/MocA family oxidoreductase [Gaiellaceae bacterium]